MADAKPTKKERIDLRVEGRDRALFGKAAHEQRETLTQFLIESGRERAERLVADRTLFRVESEEWRALEAALDRPVEIRPELARLFSRERPE